MVAETSSRRSESSSGRFCRLRACRRGRSRTTEFPRNVTHNLRHAWEPRGVEVVPNLEEHQVDVKSIELGALTSVQPSCTKENLVNGRVPKVTINSPLFLDDALETSYQTML